MMDRAWSRGHRARLAATAARWLAAASDDPLEAASIAVEEYIVNKASTTILSEARTLEAVAFYAGLNTHVLAPLLRGMRRTEGATVNLPTPATPIGAIINRLRHATATEQADMVLVAVLAGGARYSSVAAMRVGDIRLDAIVIRLTKTSTPANPRRFAVPAVAWMRTRLARWIRPAGGGRWSERALLFSPAAARRMTSVVPAKEVRRAVAQATERAMGGTTSAAILGHSTRTAAVHYLAGPSAAQRAYAEFIATAEDSARR